MTRRSLALVLLAGSPAPLGAQARVAEVYTVDGAHSLLDFTTRLVAPADSGQFDTGFRRLQGELAVEQDSTRLPARSSYETRLGVALDSTNTNAHAWRAFVAKAP